MAKSTTIGVIGLGRMGGPLARRLMRSKLPLMVWDSVAASRQLFENRKNVCVATPAAMAHACSVVFFVVPSSKEITVCLKGADGMLVNARKGLVLCDLTTSDPVDTRRLAKQAATRAIHYLDAGMSGGPAGITDGSLALMVGGDAKVLKRIQPVLDAFAKNVFHLGASGSGHAMKLINNMVLHTTFLATCEGARLTERMGMRVADMIKVFNVSTAYSYASHHRFPNNILNGAWNAQARVYNPWKDVGIAVKLARKSGANVELADRTYAFLQQAVDMGMAEQDLSLLYRDFEKIRGRRRR